MRRVLRNIALGFAVLLAVSYGAGHYLEQQQEPSFTAEEISKIKTAADELQTFAESLPDCSKGFPTGARKEIWDAYVRYCEIGVTVTKSR